MSKYLHKKLLSIFAIIQNIHDILICYINPCFIVYAKDPFLDMNIVPYTANNNTLLAACYAIE